MTLKESGKQAAAIPFAELSGELGGECMGMSDGTDVEKPKLLLHSCCGPCSTVCIERLVDEYEVTVYFYNPNITNPDEYERRKQAQLQFIRAFNEDPAYDAKVDFMEGPYIPETFFEGAKDMEDEPEGGRRCGMCFEMRLDKTAEVAKMNNFDCFTTTLTVSPHKNYEVISGIGRRIGIQYGVSYVDKNFKKKDGFKRSTELSAKYNLYRQNYCGCEFSEWWK